ncbi:hypothetical protein [Photobacterium kishitanii]|uniref:hypothetical protein n=1 Tax=Photobacterium kishitanii TaxID=318456 RepID=UPI0007F87717|nr:hypothetical protein [Photobacterium kishitanii]OBU31242.1 hypothetical protein AYY23_20225 [Photobacterium kishitanii]PSW46660.1 hypothetical protein C0W66_22270 [Photobacterium kishitanii]
MIEATVNECLKYTCTIVSSPVAIPKDKKLSLRLIQQYKEGGATHYCLIHKKRGILSKETKIIFLGKPLYPMAYAIADELKEESFIYIHLDVNTEDESTPKKPDLLVIFRHGTLVDLWLKDDFDNAHVQATIQKYIDTASYIYSNTNLDNDMLVSIGINKKTHLKSDLLQNVIANTSTKINQYKIELIEQLPNVIKEQNNFKILVPIIFGLLVGAGYFGYKQIFMSEPELKTIIIDDYKDLRNAFKESTNFKSQIVPFYHDLKLFDHLNGWSVVAVKMKEFKGTRVVSFEMKRGAGIYQQLSDFSKNNNFQIDTTIKDSSYFLLTEYRNMPVFDSPGRMNSIDAKNYILDVLDAYWPESAHVTYPQLARQNTSKKWQPSVVKLAIKDWSIEDLDTLASLFNRLPISFTDAEIDSSELNLLSGNINFKLLGI